MKLFLRTAFYLLVWMTFNFHAIDINQSLLSHRALHI